MKLPVLLVRMGAVMGALLVALAVPAANEPPASQAAVKAYREALSDWERGKQSDAVEGFTKAAELAPQWGAPNARLGVIYQLQGTEAEARAQYAVTQEASLGPPPDNMTPEQARLRSLIIANEAYVVYLINQARLDEGLPVLVPDATVGVVARRHSQEMRDRSYFEHTSPSRGQTTCQDRFFSVFGNRPRLIAENIARRWGSAFCLTEAKILGTHGDLMNSPGHRHNILYPSVEWVGVGLAANANGDYWLTEVFVEPGR